MPELVVRSRKVDSQLAFDGLDTHNDDDDDGEDESSWQESVSCGNHGDSALLRLTKDTVISDRCTFPDRYQMAVLYLCKNKIRCKFRSKTCKFLNLEEAGKIG